MRETTLSLIVITSLLSGCTSAPEVQEQDNASSRSAAPLLSQSAVVEPVAIEPFEPWSETFSRKQLGTAVMLKMNEYFDANHVDDCKWEGQIHLEKSLSVMTEVESVMEKTVSTFCNILQDDPVTIISSYGFVKTVLEDLDRPTDDHGGICGGPGAGMNTGCALYHASWVSNRLDGNMIIGVTAHELFHNVQDAMKSGRPFWRTPGHDEMFTPHWFLEGGAVTYQSAMGDYLGYWDYTAYDAYSNMLAASPNTNINLQSLETGGSFDVYVVGQFATEYLVAHIGIDGLLNIIPKIDNGKTFDESFESVVGMSLEDFYAKMSRIQIIND